MSIVLAETYVIKTGKDEEFMLLLEKFLEFKETHPQLFDGVESWRLYRQDIGQPVGLYIELWEYASLAKLEECNSRVFADDGMRAISVAYHELVEPATICSSIWRPTILSANRLVPQASQA